MDVVRAPCRFLRSFLHGDRRFAVDTSPRVAHTEANLMLLCGELCPATCNCDPARFLEGFGCFRSGSGSFVISFLLQHYAADRETLDQPNFLVPARRTDRLELIA